MIEVGQSINTWPQLASSVVLGGAVSADVTRRMFLGQMVDSGRYYVDLESIIPNSKAKFKNTVVENPYSPLAKSDMEHLIKQIPANIFIESRIDVPRDILREIVNAGIKAPSTGNDQPWKWYYHNRVLFVFHDQFRSHSFGDYRNIASYLTFGAVYENVVLATHHQRLELNATLFPAGMDSPIVLAFTFSKDKSDLAEPHSHDELANFIPSRCTNRNLSAYKEIDHGILDDLNTVVTSVAGAGLRFLTDATHIQKVGKIIGSFDRMRILNQAGHHDFVNREIRWNATDAERTKDGIDVATLGLNTSQLTALDIIKDFEVIDFVNQVKGGKVLEAAAVKSISCASAIGLITMLDKTPESYIMGGRALERLWLAAEKHSLALHPVISPLYFFPREDQQDSGLSDVEMRELKALKKSFLELFNIEDFLTGVFLFKVSYAAKPNIKSLRIPLENMLFID
jgi:hypothetical protein